MSKKMDIRLRCVRLRKLRRYVEIGMEIVAAGIETGSH